MTNNAHKQLTILYHRRPTVERFWLKLWKLLVSDALSSLNIFKRNRKQECELMYERSTNTQNAPLNIDYFSQLPMQYKYILTKLPHLRFFSWCEFALQVAISNHSSIAQLWAAVRSGAILVRCRLVVGRRTPVHPLTRKQMVHMAPAPQGENLSAEPQLRSHCQSERSSGVFAMVGGGA